MLVRLRVWAGVRFAEDSTPYATTNLAEGLLCFWCCSVWASAGLTLLAVALQQATLAEAPWLWLAGSAGAIIVDEVLP